MAATATAAVLFFFLRFAATGVPLPMTAFRVCIPDRRAGKLLGSWWPEAAPSAEKKLQVACQKNKRPTGASPAIGTKSRAVVIPDLPPQTSAPRSLDNYAYGAVEKPQIHSAECGTEVTSEPVTTRIP